MRVLAVTHSLQTNGAAYALVRLLVALKKAGASVSVLHTENQSLCEPLRANGVDIVKDVHSSSFDVAIVNTLIDYHWVEKIAPLLPVLFWVHEGKAMLDKLEFHNEWTRAFRLSSRIVFQTPWQTESIFQSVLNYVQPHRIRYVPLGIPVRQGDVPLKPESTRRMVISIGSVYLRKRTIDLVYAVQANANIGMQCKFVGSLKWSEENDPELLALIRRHPQTFALVGESPASNDMLDNSFINQHMDSSGIYVSASMDESFGLANLEAAAWGLPPALSDLPCYKGIWKHGENALLHPVGKVDCLAWNLRALALDHGLHQRIAHAARATSRRFATEHFVQNMAQVLEECITDRLVSL